nr:sigma-70 family RNA polymerase sigma factor [Labilibaculum sp.]
MNKAIAELPEQSRKVVVCVMVQNMKYQEAADELGVSINTVKTNLKRGVLKLREVLKDKEELLFLFLLSKRK